MPCIFAMFQNNTLFSMFRNIKYLYFNIMICLSYVYRNMKWRFEHFYRTQQYKGADQNRGDELKIPCLLKYFIEKEDKTATFGLYNKFDKYL